MIYQPELYYFFGAGDFPLQQSLLVTAKAVSKFSSRFSARLICPSSWAETRAKAGGLPQDEKEREKLIEDIFGWIASDSEDPELFALFLYGGEGNKNPNECEKFDHHDDTCYWALNLTTDEFRDVQDAWRRNGLPEDMFYPSDSGIQAGSYYYTPKQWEAKKRAKN